MRAAIAVDHVDRAPATLDPRWSAQFEQLGLPTFVAPKSGAWLGEWADAAGIGVLSEVEGVIEVLQCLRWIPVLEQLIPPPGGSTRRTAHRTAPRPPRSETSAERAMLGKIRALLAKAESTTFEAEAEALTAKAQELMTREAIDAAMLVDEAHGAGEVPVAIRIAIDDPYVDAKSLLLHVVAKAGRCRAVFFAEIAATTVIGFATDVAGVELLYTSLLVQAQTSLNNASRAMPAGSRQRSRSFRSSFLLAYGHRIGERLEAIGAQVIADAEASMGRSVLPALLSREVAVDEAVEQRYGALVSRRVRGGHDAAGWASGSQAADQAELVAGALPKA